MLLSGRDLAGFIKERHYQEVKRLGFTPKLAIVMSNEADLATRTYVESSKSRYGSDIGVEVEVHEVEGDTAKVTTLINKLNDDPGVDGIIVQLPFVGLDTDQVLALVAPAKDVDGLAPKSQFDPATPKAIIGLLGAHEIDWHGKTVAVVGQGRLVGAPLAIMLENSGATVIRCDSQTNNLATKTRQADIIITATGRPGLITTGMVKSGAVIIDAGTAEIDGNLTGDVDHALYDDPELKITPNPGGVGPVTVAALFDNVLIAATKRKKS